MAAEAPGAAFLQRRLARARAVPPAERSPEVQAFITSVELGRQICELLPLQQSGGGGGDDEEPAALPLGDPTTARRAICAVLKLVQASYLCYDAPVFDCDVAPHFNAYLEALDSAAEGGAYSQLAGNLLAFVQLIHDSQLDMPDSEQLQAGLQSYHQLFGTPPAVQAAVSRQLEQLSAEQPREQPPFTTRKLQVAWLGLIVRNAGDMLHAHDHVMQGQLPPAEQPAVDAAAAAMQFAAHTWLQLEPHCDRAVEAQAFAAPISRLATVWPRSQPQDVSSVLEAYSRAQAQQRPYAAARCAVFATNLALLVPLEPDTLRAVMDAFETAEHSLRACKAMLPEAWVAAVAVGFKAARMGVPGLQARLQLQTGGPGAAGERRLSAVAAMEATFDFSRTHQMKQVADQETERFDRLCEACGKQAVGLRSCARCRAVRYCSRECQAAHWPQHRHECRPA